MAEQKINTLNTRIQNKIDTADEWDKAQWTPLDGELLVYRHDDGSIQIKFGNGSSKPSELPFAVAKSISEDDINALFNTSESLG